MFSIASSDLVAPSGLPPPIIPPIILAIAGTVIACACNSSARVVLSWYCTSSKRTCICDKVKPVSSFSASTGLMEVLENRRASTLSSVYFSSISWLRSSDPNSGSNSG